MTDSIKAREERILVLVPTQRDAQTTATILHDAGLKTLIVKTLSELCEAAEAGAGAALLTEEALANDRQQCVSKWLRKQPAWSDFPLVVLTRSGLDLRTPFDELKNFGRMTLVPRPVQIAGLVSNLEAAVRDRRRQYALRDHLAERDRVEEALRDADRRKHEFLAMLAHELRNPLAAVRTATTLLGQGSLNDQEQQWMLQVLDRQVTQLNRLIDDLLDVSRVTRGKIELKKSVIQVSEVVERALEVARPMLSAAGHEVIVTGPPTSEPLWIEADPARIEQVVVNLLNNAAKYTPSGGHVWLSFCRAGNQLQLAVRDDGLGIEPHMLAKIFDMFTQVRHSLDRSEGGLGIGLTVVQRLVQMHGGSVSAESAGVGQGSKFIVHLPLVAPPSQASPANTSQTDCHSSRRVLIVDDNRDSASTLAILLRQAGYETAVAYDGLSGAKVAHTFQPEVALLDIGLPGIDGYTLAQRLRSSQDLKNTLLVAVSGYGQPDDRRRSQEAGFDHHLVKPINSQQLLQLIQDASAQMS